MENLEAMARIRMWRTGIFRAVSHEPLAVNTSEFRGDSFSLQRTADSLRGFTLIELLVVILILSITISFIVPRIIGKEDVELRGAVRKLLNTAKKLSDDAVFRKEKMALNLDIDGRGYGAKEGGNLVSLPDNVTIEGVLLGKQIIRKGMVTITFFPSGLRDEAIIRLTDRTGKRKYDVYIPALGERFEIREE
jgi:prepilin-type N-terminal cleavage/methylation domain-containing protein